MFVRSFWMVCAATLLAAFTLFVAGYFTPLVVVVFGFIAFGLTFMGMISVLPSLVTHPTEPRTKVAPKERPAEVRETAIHGFNPKVGMRTS